MSRCNYYCIYNKNVVVFLILFFKNNTWPDDNGINKQAESLTNHKITMLNGETETDFCAHE